MGLTDAQITARLETARISLSECIQALQARAAPSQPQIAPQPVPAGPHRPIAWGAKVSATFRERVWWICDTLAMNPDDLMACMAWESGRSFAPDKKNLAGSGATGLIQFMPATAKALGTTTAKLAAMTAEDQLNFVYRYLRPFAGRAKTLSDLYAAIIWPKAVGKPDDYIVFDGRSGGIAYRQNAGLDTDKNKVVTKAEMSAKLYAMRAEGLRLENVA